MVVTIVHVKVQPEYIQNFIEATKLNHQKSIQEPENMRFDILQAPEDESQFILYEAYQTEAGAKAHKQTQHYLSEKQWQIGWPNPVRVYPMM